MQKYKIKALVNLLEKYSSKKVVLKEFKPLKEYWTYYIIAVSDWEDTEEVPTGQHTIFTGTKKDVLNAIRTDINSEEPFKTENFDEFTLFSNEDVDVVLCKGKVSKRKMIEHYQWACDNNTRGTDFKTTLKESKRIFNPENLLRKAVLTRLITIDEYNDPKFKQAAEEVADNWAKDDDYAGDFGSSDMTFAIQSFLYHLGIKNKFIDGTLTRLNDDGTPYKLYESKKLKESKFQYTYFETFSGAVQFARAEIEKKGYFVDENSWFREINTGKGRPKEGHTNSFSIELLFKGKNSEEYKVSKKLLHIQVYNRGNNISKPYELNYYIS